MTDKTMLMMSKKTIQPVTLFDSRPYGFSQVVVVPSGKMVFISGQVAWDAEKQLVGEGDLAVQVHKALQNLQSAIESVGGTLEDIVLLHLYLVDYQQDQGAVISDALLKFFNPGSLPASSWISVAGLANPGFLIEIEAQARME